MPKKLNLVGKRFGRLLVLEEAGRNRLSKVLWRCMCECNKIIIVKADSLLNGHTMSCGCLRKEKLVESNRQRAFDLIGQRFGRLLVLKKVYNIKRLSWSCLCTCGNEVVISTGNLMNGSTVSCGCLQREWIIKRNKQPVSAATRQKMSKSKKGKYCGKDSHKFGKVVSVETRQKMSKTRIERCLAKGKNNANWKGGISKEPYGQEWTKELRESIRQRDGYKCMNPYCFHKTGHAAILIIHHIDGNKNNCCPENLIVLCRSCHGRVSKDQGWHESWYKAILYRRYGYDYGL
jgi:hypothetical protein